MYKAFLIVAFASISIAHAQTIPSLAQDYPSKPVRMIVPWAAGGTSDVAGRIRCPETFSEMVQSSFHRKSSRRRWNNWNCSCREVKS
jgi:tripartite-type tricarboxylate transporter receptor subunit TctC